MRAGVLDEARNKAERKSLCHTAIHPSIEEGHSYGHSKQRAMQLLAYCIIFEGSKSNQASQEQNS